MISLAAAGITELTLASDGIQREEGGNTIFGEGTFTRADGSAGSFADVALGADPVIARAQPGDADFGRPLVLNLVGDRVYTTALEATSVTFDITGDGTSERTGWTAGPGLPGS